MTHKFEFGQRVIADGDPAVVMVATGVTYRAHGAAMWECAYWANGEHREVWIYEWRLSPAEPRGRA